MCTKCCVRFCGLVGELGRAGVWSEVGIEPAAVTPEVAMTSPAVFTEQLGLRERNSVGQPSFWSRTMAVPNDLNATVPVGRACELCRSAAAEFSGAGFSTERSTCDGTGC